MHENENSPEYHFFCGLNEKCSVGGKLALQLAKYNIENYYSVVGVTSHLNLTMAVLEAYLPRFFSGLTNVYGRYKLGNHIYAKVIISKIPLLPVELILTT